MGVYHYTVDLTWDGAGSPGANVWDIEAVAGGSSEAANLQLATDAIEQFYDDLLTVNFYPQSYTVTGRTEAVNIATSNIEPVTGWTQVTASTSQNYAGLLQMICTIRTISATRRGRGRKFIGPVDTTLTSTDGTPSSSAVGFLQAACDGLMASSTGAADWSIGVYSSVDLTFRTALSMQARDYFAALRSRRD